MSEYGIKETKELGEFLISFGEAIAEAREDGKIGVSDIPLLIGPFTKAVSGFAGITQVPDEIKDLDESEKEELKQWFKDNFDLGHDQTEAIVETGVGMVLDLFLFIKDTFVKEDEEEG